MASDEYYIEGIRSNDAAVLKEIYRSCSQHTVNFVKNNNGTIEDARDVFQDGLLIVFNKIRKGDFELTSSFNTYITAVCKYVWLKKITRRRKYEVTFDPTRELKDEYEIEAEYQMNERQLLFEQYFSRLSEECQRVLKMYFDRMKGADIAIAMNYSEEYVKRKKYKCKETLVAKIRKDEIYRELMKP